MVHPRGRTDGTGRPWYLAELDEDTVIVEPFAAVDKGQKHREPSGTADGAFTTSKHSERDSRSRPSRPNRQSGRLYLVDDEDIVFVPADHSSLVGVSSTYQPRPSNNRKWFLMRSGGAASVTLIITLLSLYYYWYHFKTARASTPFSKESKESRECIAKSKKTTGRVGASNTSISGHCRSAERKRAKKKRQKEKKKAMKEQQQQQQVTATHQTLSAIRVKKEEDITITTCSTPPASPAVNKAVQQQSRLQLATPKTPLEYKMHVETIASVVSATGLSKQNSLQIANEAVIRRLDYQLSQNNLMQNEMRREKLEETRREEDRKDTDRRHEESIKAIRGEKGLLAKAIEARRRCTETAFQIFPGGHFLMCISLALVSMFSCLNFGSVLRDIYTDETQKTYMCAIRQVCGCLHEGKNQAGSELAWYSLSLSPYFRYASNLCPSVMNAYLFAPISGWVDSTTCLASCLLKCGVFLTALGLIHRLLRLFHSHEFVHQSINVLSVSSLLMSALVNQSPTHDTSTALLLDLAIPILATNILIMNAICGLTLWSKGFDDNSLRRAGGEDEAKLEKTLFFLTWLPKVSRLVTSLAALGVGVYWGMR